MKAKTILLVDDATTARMVIKRCFEIAGYHDSKFVEAANGVEAVMAASRHDVDLIVSDLNMPLMDGREFLTKIKADEFLSHIPVIMITSSMNEALRDELVGIGAVAVLGKPVSPMIIAETMKGI